MNNKKNFITALVLQIVTILSGIILPRIIIDTFGSEINGLLSSITQFLSFISLLEGGLGAVVLSELYKPISEHNDELTISILASCQRFFTKLTVIFMLYTVVLGIIYSNMLKKEYSFEFTCSLVFILSVTTTVQYLFAITYKLLLQAQQKIYIVNVISSIIVIANLILAVILVSYYRDIHVIKLGSAIVFLLQPLILRHFVEEKFKNRAKRKSCKDYAIKNRWNGFSQNLAHFISLNTDVAVITIFLSLIDVSIYTIYMLPITALRSIVCSCTNSYQSVLGDYYVKNEHNKLKVSFEKFNKFNLMVSTSLFGTCILLINFFVSLYTQGIKDANYYQPMFALVIVLANMIYCIREPYRYLILATGKFEETNFGAIFEAILNIGLSILLIKRYKLLGVAIGTIIAVGYRFVYFSFFLKKEIINKCFSEYIENAIKLILFVILNMIVYFLFSFNITDFFEFIIHGVIIFFVELVVAYFLFYKMSNKRT